jgi:hypothetical protein
MWLLFYIKPLSAKQKNPFTPNYNMIDNVNPDKFSGLVESISNFEVFLTEGGFSAWVVMNQGK